ncbi:E3 SUMO-protein ligase ZBED1-like [Pseudophryne corroboree]|uniref:E3 SUMO-protein ligase ZBED1-like n=1 Tax=Pseudophryne corroboree TaxID=495146 RepID=UPI003081D84C
MPPKNKVWKHFERNPDKSATCRYCGALVKTSGYTSNLMGHLERKHPEMLHLPSSSTGKMRMVSAEWDEAVANVEGEQQPLEPSPTAAPPQVRARQVTITNAFQRVNEGKDEKITKAIVKMVCRAGYPYNVGEDEAFRDLFEVLAPLYTMPTTKAIIQRIREKYKAISSRVREILANNPCSLSMDSWTYEDGYTCHSLTAHYYNDEEELCSATLGAEVLEECTSEDLAKQLKHWCRKWGIRPETENVTAIVTDGDALMKEAAELAFGRKKHISCFARGLNSVVEACLGIQAVSPLLSKAKAVVAWFEEDDEAAEELRKISRKRLTQSVPTRCNSTYHMLQRLIELRFLVSEIIDRQPDAPPMLTDPELEDVGEILEILEPFQAATKLLVEEHYLAGSMVIPVTSIILDKLERLHPNKVAPLNVLAEAIGGMKRSFGTVEHVFLLAVATFLDPRFKNMYFSDPTTLSKQVRFFRYSMNSSDSGSSSESDDVLVASNYLFDDHNRMVQKDRQQFKATSSCSPMSDELSLYLGSPVEKIKVNPLRYWKQMQTTYPNLTMVAKRCLTSVATSVPGKWLYTKDGEMESIWREELHVMLRSKLLFLRSADIRLWEY